MGITVVGLSGAFAGVESIVCVGAIGLGVGVIGKVLDKAGYGVVGNIITVGGMCLASTIILKEFKGLLAVLELFGVTVGNFL